MRHLDEGTIHAWLDGALSAEAERKAETHAARCTECAVAVADARGLIAATSRILTALDDVPAGVIPAGKRDGAHRVVRATAPRRLPGWTIRIAASIAVVATGSLLYLRSRPEGFQLGRSPARANNAPAAELPVSVSASASATTPAPPGTVAEGAKTTTLDMAVEVKEKAADRRQDSLVPGRLGIAAGKGAPGMDTTPLAAPAVASAQLRAAARAPTPAAPASSVAVLANNDKLSSKSELSAPSAPEPDSGNAAARNLAGVVATVPPKIEVASQSSALGAAKRAAALEQMGLPPGWRLVSDQRNASQARVVERRVYEVRPGVEVTYAIFAPPAAPAARAPSAQAADAAASASDSDDKQDADGEGPGVNSIRWTDANGRAFRLSGRLPLDSLRVLRPMLPPLEHPK